MSFELGVVVAVPDIWNGMISGVGLTVNEL